MIEQSYFVAGSLLFLFWAYGLVSFVLDVKNKFVPGVRRYLENRGERKEEAKRAEEREERERQLL
ncbi:hypothetical protein ACFQE8_00490 [Salinirubellus sp. GCM10025818]|jgi:hypothetical protein|uniref:hypothetical protein n=1 Tax=Salinirubellus TaxID=2162630 RepID=UPI0030D0D419